MSILSNAAQARVLALHEARQARVIYTDSQKLQFLLIDLQALSAALPTLDPLDVGVTIDSIINIYRPSDSMLDSHVVTDKREEESENAMNGNHLIATDADHNKRWRTRTPTKKLFHRIAVECSVCDDPSDTQPLQVSGYQIDDEEPGRFRTVIESVYDESDCDLMQDFDPPQSFIAGTRASDIKLSQNDILVPTDLLESITYKLQDFDEIFQGIIDAVEVELE